MGGHHHGRIGNHEKKYAVFTQKEWFQSGLRGYVLPQEKLYHNPKMGKR